MGISTQTRQPRGTSSGGQFATAVNPEPTLDLRNVGEIVSDSRPLHERSVNDAWRMEW